MNCKQHPSPRPAAWLLSLATAALSLLTICLLMCPAASAQLAGKGQITGKIADASSAAIPGAVIVLTNDATGVSTTTKSTGTGDYVIPTLDPGIYTVTVTAPGFDKLTQKNVHINALESQTFSPKLVIGAETTTITVDAQPPQLETSNATLGATMEQELYSSLPIEMGAYGQPDQRRATDFAFLMPGVQGNNTTGNATTNTGIVNGSGSRGGVSVVYIDGTPFVRAGGGGDPRFVWTAISVDAVDQFQLQTSGYSAIYEGQGIQNYSIKQGGPQYHGALYEFFRNTALDTWGWLGSVPNPVTGKPSKPIEHSNEYGINFSGPLIPFGAWKDKLFFFGNYNGFRYASGTPTLQTFPTLTQRTGDFTATGLQPIYDPATQAQCTANNGGQPCRYQFGYGPGSVKTFSATSPGNPIPTGAAVNVIPAARISQLSQNLQQFLPTSGVTTALQNNYVAPNQTGLVNWSTTDRIDYLISPKHMLTMIGAIGRQASSNPVGQTTAGRNVGPIPYNYGQTYAPKTAVGIIEETWTVTPHLVNQLKYGYSRYNGPTFDADQLPSYSLSSLGFTGLPSGPASGAFPITTFAAPNAPTGWAGTSPSVTLAENFTLLDNVQWTRGRHSFTFGGQIAWLEYNVVNATGGSTDTTIAAAVAETAQLTQPKTGTATPTYSAAPSTGVSYASFLLGDYDKVSFTQYGVQESAARFRAISPYAQDNWKVSDRLTLDLGLRWDYWPPLVEAHDNMSFFDPNLSYTVPGTTTTLKGGLNFTGTGAGTCNCRTPAQTYWKNFGPRLGAAYQIDSNTVLRASWGVMFTHGNGVGGGTTSLGTTGFSNAPSLSETLQVTTPYSGAFPAYAQPAGRASGPAFSIVGNTNLPGYTSTSPASAGFADPYLGSRAPEYLNYTLGIQHQWGKAFTSTMTYVGSQGHFLPADGSNARGLYANQLDPKYQSLGANLNLSGAGLQTYCAANAGICPANYSIAVSTLSLGSLLKPYPYQGVSDTFGDVANSNYNSLQVVLSMRASHGLTFSTNYTWSRSIDDGGTFRTGYAIPAGGVFNDPKSYTQDRIERSVSTSNQPHHLVVTGVYELPFGRRVLNSNAIERAIFGGFKFSEIFQAFSGSPLAITASACPTNPAQIAISSSVCGLPYLNPNYTGTARINGKHYGAGALAANATATSYIAPSICSTALGATGPFIAPAPPSGQSTCLNTALAPSYTLANAPRTAPYGLTGPGNYQLDFALVRSFPLHVTEASRLNFRAEMYNVTNHTFFAVASTQVGNASFGTVTTNASYNRRAVQLSARVEF
ncbi:MAG TPA: TonB-dependent receptor [Acidobacteriaceae bacterium]|nr:TonB-dependent receptor [Acidobacteriaceae bacterium]